MTLACEGKHVETVQLLLEHRADPHRKNAKGLTPDQLSRDILSKSTATTVVLRQAVGG
ncbi:ankyrin repeat domain-containing protein [Loktanella salsilacus]|uniref:ankyrin repeat domain-containing protein n=1 Tax=Loktanella salsilacus TaxID=195913 RepID=UPI0037360613